MRTHEGLTVILLLSLVTVCTTTHATEKQLSNTRAASCIVKITADPAIVPLNERTIMNLLSSSDVGRGPIREIVGAESAGDLSDFIEVEWLSGTLQMAGADSMGAGMSGMGSMGGGMMGGMGLGSMGGGIMGGMGMGSMGGGMMGGVGMGAGAGSSGPLQQCATFGLYVNLPERANAAAEELLAELINNLDHSLSHAFELYQGRLNDAVTQAERRRQYAQEQLNALTGGGSLGDKQIRQQLNERVDMSMLSPEMKFSDAIEAIKNSTNPPLPIVVLWKDLAENADIEPGAPIGMDGLPGVRLESVLKALLKAMGAGSSELFYRIDDDVILISTEDPSDAAETLLGGAPAEVDVRDLIERRRDLAANVRDYEMRIATSEAREQAMHMQMAQMREEAVQKLKEDSVILEMNQLVALSETHLHHLEDQVRAGRLPETALNDAQEKIAKAKIDLARRREELGLSAGGRRLSSLSEDLGEMAVEMFENRAALEILTYQLAEVDQQLAQARVSDPRAGQIRMAQQIVNMAEQRVIELNRQLTNLQKPIVTMIGAN